MGRKSSTINYVRVGKIWYLSDFACRCCQRVMLDPISLSYLEELDKRLGGGLKINSAYRCPDHNKAVGGVPSSYHLKGLAYDVTHPKYHPQELGALAFEVGFKTVMSYYSRWFCHLDRREKGLGLIRKYR